MTRLLVVTAVEAERNAILAAVSVPITVLAGGVGPAASAAAAARALAGGQFDAVLCAGIGGGFPTVAVGDVVVADRVVFADLGAETPAGFLPASELGFSGDSAPDADLAARLVARTGARSGTVLTVATVTGTASTTAALLARFPDAIAEGMEGAGVGAAAALCGVPFGELRAISNLVGPRDRDSWRIATALDALGRAAASVTADLS